MGCDGIWDVVKNQEDLNIRESETTIPHSFDITIQNDNYTIRMKAGSEYFLASDNVSQWAKIFIDNYELARYTLRV